MRSGRSVSCKFEEDYLNIDFHDLMTLRILLCYLLSFDSNIASLWRSARTEIQGGPGGHGPLKKFQVKLL